MSQGTCIEHCRCRAAAAAAGTNISIIATYLVRIPKTLLTKSKETRPKLYGERCKPRFIICVIVVVSYGGTTHMHPCPTASDEPSASHGDDYLFSDYTTHRQGNVQSSAGKRTEVLIGYWASQYIGRFSIRHLGS